MMKHQTMKMHRRQKEEYDLLWLWRMEQYLEYIDKKMFLKGKERKAKKILGLLMFHIPNEHMRNHFMEWMMQKKSGNPTITRLLNGGEETEGEHMMGKKKRETFFIKRQRKKHMGKQEKIRLGLADNG
ncbi:hypothetical protein Tco_0294181 [Tanacetum coccineum]